MKTLDNKGNNKNLPPKIWGSGALTIGAASIDVYVLEDGRTLIGKQRIMNALGRPTKGDTLNQERPNFISARNLQPFINTELEELLKGVDYYDGNTKKSAYSSDILAQICGVYLEARTAGVLTANQLPIAQQCETLVMALSKVAISALIYEQLGFERMKHPEAYRMLIDSYLSEEIRKWSKEFPDELFIQMDRIYGNQKTTSRNRPMYYAKFIRKYIYDPIENGLVLVELDNKTPKNAKGLKTKRLHQSLSEEIGLPNLRAQIWQVIGVLKTSPGKRQFENAYARLMGNSRQGDLFEDS
jgi:hypothetical protein